MIRYHLLTLIEQKSFDDGRKITLKDVALETDIHRATLSRMINSHQCNITTDTIDRLCNYFNVPVEKLIEHVPEK
ncbi:helix-turn-helix domain-containing protein [Alishewanella sp. HL-SH05]|uniref:helix-turn-helix domain-containing protein n=1 Tax=Alishewanella sp. HL-SH05 TaxID=3461145 RepID=UPI004041EB30